MDVSSDIYKIYIQDSRAAQYRLEMHKTFSLMQLQQMSRTCHKESVRFQTTSQSPSKVIHSTSINNDDVGELKLQKFESVNPRKTVSNGLLSQLY